MSTLDDLRQTLEEYAVGADDPDASAGRTAAIRNRIAGLRRRRRAALAGTVAAVVVAVAAIGVGADLVRRSSHTPGPMKRPGVSRVAVPDHVTANGYQYDLLETVTGSPGRGPIAKVGPSKQMRVVVVTGHGLGGGAATLYTGGQPIDRLVGDGSTEPLLTSGRDLTVRYHGTPRDASVTITVYQHRAGLPVFPELDLGRLRVARTAATGKAGVSLSFRSDGGDVEAPMYCVSPKGGPRIYTHVQIDDRPALLGVGCARSGADEPLLSTSATVHVPAGQHRAKLWLSTTEHGRPHVFPGVSLGLAAYVADPIVAVGGFHAPRTVQAGGRLWTLVPRDRTGQTVRTAEPMLAVGVFRAGGYSRTPLDGRVVRLPDGSLTVDTTVDYTIETYGMVLPGWNERLSLPKPPPGGGVIVLYRLAD